MEVLRTPDRRFEGLKDWPFEAKFCDVPAFSADPRQTLRMAYVDEGPKDAAELVVCMHGEPSWSYLYRYVIPVLTKAGHRVVCPDLMGLGRSDKPTSLTDYSYDRHVRWMSALLIDHLNIGVGSNVTLVCQDWGGLIGLRVLTANPDRFSRLVVANTGLPTGNENMPDAFKRWQHFSKTADVMPVGKVIQGGSLGALTDEEVAAYEAPFPDERYKASARIFPSLVPTSPEDPEAANQMEAWAVLSSWEKPCMTAFADSDPITKGGHRVFQSCVPGCEGQTHVTMTGCSHFVSDPRLGEAVADFIARNPVSPKSRL